MEVLHDKGEGKSGEVGEGVGVWRGGAGGGGGGGADLGSSKARADGVALRFHSFTTLMDLAIRSFCEQRESLA